MADRPILVVCDSRGRTLEPEILKTFIHLDVKVIWQPGLTLLATFQFAKEYILSLKPKIIYILTGICDLTQVYSHSPRMVILRNVTTQETVYSYMQKVDLVHSQIFSLKRFLGYGPMIVFPTQTGADMGWYSHYPGDRVHPQQLILDESISIINRNITTQNNSMRVFTPFLASPVHTRCRGKVRTMYNKLSDGCHLTQELSNLWAIKLYENSLKNANKYDQYNLTNHLYSGH